MPTPLTQITLDRLTARQLQCLELAARHWTSKDIGRQLDISPKTVDRHIEEAVRKLEATDRAAAVRMLLALEAEGGRSDPVSQSKTVGRQGFAQTVPIPGEEPHEERAPLLEMALAAQTSRGEGEGLRGKDLTDVHLDGRSGRLGDSGRHLAAEEGGVVAGTLEAGLDGYVSRRAPSGNHQFGHSPWGGTTRVGAWAPEPARRLGWVILIAAGLALTAGSLIGAYDLIGDLQHIEHRIATPAPGV